MWNSGASRTFQSLQVAADGGGLALAAALLARRCLQEEQHYTERKAANKE